jgi:uncharacterized protein
MVPSGCGTGSRGWPLQKERPPMSDQQNVIDKELLKILACPACKTPVRLEDQKLICETCDRRYPIRDGIPIMLMDEAEQPGKQPPR